jgi:hypothetical protein
MVEFDVQIGNLGYLLSWRSKCRTAVGSQRSNQKVF